MGGGHFEHVVDQTPYGFSYELSSRQDFNHAASNPAVAVMACGQTSVHGGGLVEAPDDSERPDEYAYDPMDPIPLASLATDQRSIGGRMLTYTSGILDRDLKIVGPVEVTLHASSSARDTDWVVNLNDVWPDGRSIALRAGVLRARYRNSFEEPELMSPGEIYKFEVDLGATANVFKFGHRIRVHVTSCAFPLFGRNLNTGGVNAAETAGIVAHNMIHHDADHPSHILLPVIGKF